MRSFRFVIERTTVERTEVEVDAVTLSDAAAIAERYPYGTTSQDRRRMRTVREFGREEPRVDHDVVSGREK